MSLIGGLIAGGVALGGSLIASRRSKKNVQQQGAFAKQEAEAERKSALDMWNRQTSYNAPEQQMARLQAAGLNPNLAYGSGNVAGLSADTPEHYKRASTPDYGEQFSGIGQAMQQAPNILSQYQDFRYKAAQTRISNTEADFRHMLLSQRSQKLTSDIDLSSMRGKEIKERLPYVQELAKYSSESQKANIDRIREQTRGLELQNDLDDLLKPYGLTTRDNALLRQIVRVMSKENPNISAVDVAMLLPMLLPGIGTGAATLRGMRTARHLGKAGKVVARSRKGVSRINYRPRF